MKKRTKKVLGSCSLLVVAAVTAFAAFLPAPETSAVTDTITINVFPSGPYVAITDFNVVRTARPEISFNVDFSSVREAELSVEYENKNGQSRYDTIGRWLADYEPEEKPFVVNFRELTGLEDGELLGLKSESKVQIMDGPRKIDVSETVAREMVKLAVANGQEVNFRLAADEKIPYGYGYYTFRLNGWGYEEEMAHESVKKVEYVPVLGQVVEDSDGNYVLEMDYEYDDGEGEPHGIAEVEVTVRNLEDGSIYWQKTFADGRKSVELPFKKEAYRVKYDVSWQGIGRNGDRLYKSETVEVQIGEGEKPSENGPSGDEITPPNTGAVVGKPDTGRFLGGLNLSRVDYLVSGLIIFGIVVVAGVVFVLKGGKQKTKRK